MTHHDTTSEQPFERLYPGAENLRDESAVASRLQPATDLDRWHMVLGYTIDNVSAVMAFQAQEFLSDGDPDQIPISVTGPEGNLKGTVGMPRISLTLAAGACLVLPLRSLQLNGRDITAGTKDLRLGFHLDVTVEPYTIDQFLGHPVVGDDVKFALKKLLESGQVTRESHGLAALRCHFTRLDLRVSLEPSETQLNGIAEGDRPPLLALLQRWFRSLDETRNPFFLGVMVLARNSSPGPWLDTEPTLASFAYVLNFQRAPGRSQIALLLNCRGMPAPQGHVPGRFVFSNFHPPNIAEPYQGSLCVLPKLLITDHLIPLLRKALQMPTAPVGPGFTMSDKRVRQEIYRVNPYGIEYNECLRSTDTRSVRIEAAGGVDPTIGRYAAVDIKVSYQRHMLSRKVYPGMNNNQTVFNDSDFDHQFPMDAILDVTVRFRFTVRERRFVADRGIETQWKPSQATADMFWRMRDFGRGHATMADLYEKELRKYDIALAMVQMLQFNLLPERSLLPGRILLSYRDPQGASFSTFDRPWAIYFSLTRNV